MSHEGCRHPHKVENNAQKTHVSIIGLGANVSLLITKAAAAYLLSSAALLADAVHSFSDLVADLVVLFSLFLTSKLAPSVHFPFGTGKFETLASLFLFFLLVGAAFTIASYSYSLISTLNTANPEHTEPNAAWFALASMLIKEYLYRSTLAVAKKENSSVLLASAQHHRTDAYSSAIALVAIIGSVAGIPFLDPISGFIVAFVILRQAFPIGWSCVCELVDRVPNPEFQSSLHAFALDQIHSSSSSSPLSFITDIPDIRTYKAGSYIFVDFKLVIPVDLPASNVVSIQTELSSRIKSKFTSVTEVNYRISV